jgi:adenylate cyclase
MKALRKDRTRRHASANELAGDLERYMRNEKVAPGPAWLTYRSWRGLASSLALALIPGILGILLSGWPQAESFEKRGLDLLFSMRGRLPAPKDVCVVVIDDDTYSGVGRDVNTMWPRERHAELIRTLKHEGARAVAFDVLFSTESAEPAQDAAFAKALADSGNVILGSSVEMSQSPDFSQARIAAPYEPFAKAAAAVADVNIPTDSDGVIRYAWPARGGQPGLALAAYELATGDTTRRTPDVRLLDFYGPARTIKTVSIYQALNPYLPPGFFKEQIVFVGASIGAAQGFAAKDAFLTPFHGRDGARMYGVEVHATLAANLIEHREVKLLDRRLEAAFLLLLPIPILFVRARVSAIVFIGLEVLLWIVVYLAFARAEVWMPLIIPSAVQLPLAYLVTLGRSLFMGRSTDV